ncbi:hypothetical protein ASPZODRAFT_104626 [Penicilliopsis zonata CBS 506.65]|uniref:Nucleolar protein 16 n=1 Tax=Penicilliopsis zonata CBS 506.65 TaxID=1073090 RepID=A0A1L9S6T9_9EURO|nr:hypothetical protein ASPZODRAFT_104626 [Penicilliopsis zonata CBS 506.65]OJJ42871.1 hypothetical protein ASPZODRAFT_104626 [Penicilliopsis zonata CBS 506.65]
MGREIQKKKNRSSLPKNRSKKRGTLKNGNKKINVLGNAIIAENWDRNQTLTQNYRRLGLVHRLNAPTGGVEKRAKDDGSTEEVTDSLHITGSIKTSTKLSLGETRVERDPETGKILRVIRDDDKDEEIEIAGRKLRRTNPLNDPLNDLSDNEDAMPSRSSAADSAIVRKLELQAARESAAVQKKKPRHQSQRENEWISRLVDKYGEDYRAMSRDRKMNPMQQTEGDLRRRVRKWKQANA